MNNRLTGVLTGLLLASLGAISAARAEGGPELVVQTGHTEFVTSFSVSADGRLVLTGSSNTAAVLWDAETGRQLRTFLEPYVQSISSPAFRAYLSGDGRRVLTDGPKDTSILWDAVTGAKLRTFEGGFACLSADGRRALTRPKDKPAALWDADTGRQLRTFEVSVARNVGVSLSRDGGRLLAGSDDKTAALWDADSGEKLRTFDAAAVTLSADGRRALTGSDKGDAMLWDADTGRKLKTFTGAAVALDAEGRRVLTRAADWKSATWWDADSGEKLRTFDGSPVPPTDNGRRVLTRAGEKATLWDAESGRKLQTLALEGRVDPPWSPSFSTDGRRLAVCTFGQRTVVWDTQTGRNLRTYEGDAAAMSADGRHVLTQRAGDDRPAALWDVESGRKLQTFAGDRGFLSADGGRVLTTFDPATLWDGDTGRKLRTFEGHPAHDPLSGDGRRVLTHVLVRSAEDVPAFVPTLWDADSGRKLQTFAGSEGTLSRDGRRVVTRDSDRKAVMVWDADSGRKLRTLDVGGDRIEFAVPSADGRRALVSTGLEAGLWDAESGKRLQTFRGHQLNVINGTLSADGRQAVTASYDGTARLWDTETGKELCSLVSIIGGRDWLVVTPEGLFDGSPGGRDQVSYRVGKGLTVVPVDRFFQDLYRPGLLAAIAKGERPRPSADFGKQQPPAVRIVAPKQGGTVESSTLTVEAEARDEGGGVLGPWLFHNGARVVAADGAEKDDKVTRRRFTVALVPGDNRLEVKASSADGSWESEPAALTLRYERPMDKPTLYIVAVGVSKYAQAAYKLKFARADAEAIADLFERRGKGTLYKDVKVTLLRDEDATKEKIRKAMEEAAGKAQAQDTLLLFLAGHGALVGQRYYFIPHDFQTHAGKERDDDVRDQGIAADVLGDFLCAGKALKRMLILDTCASGGAVDLFQVATRDPFAFRGEVERLSRGTGVYVLAASAATEEAKEPEKLGHGALSYALLAGLKGVKDGPLERKWAQASGTGQVVDVLEWFGFAAGQVPRLTKEYCGHEQNVHTAGRGTSFPVLPLDER